MSNDTPAIVRDTPTSALIHKVNTAITRANHIILGKEPQIRLSLACLLTGGHLLIEDIPGVGKTTLAQTLARLLGLSYQRIQFTSDLLPADIIGASIYEQQTASFRFHPGPIFTQLMLADEVNRATPKTQSALLEAMEEQQVTVDGETRALPRPFFVIATQNPVHQVGTFPLPESQLDRFLMRIALGYPGEHAERELLKGEDRRTLLSDIEPALNAHELIALRKAAAGIHVSDALLDYLQAVVRHTRESPRYETGLSPRAALALKHASQAWALLAGHSAVLPEDIQAILPGVTGHRLRLKASHESVPAAILAQELIEAVPIP
ncbi:MAG TPA: AAA family ATPase [Gammaproteobacteria bacterium]|jgi:MoxR-like ATPase|nr:AAA family ATPase [Gammaproteobacteria bacterium]